MKYILAKHQKHSKEYVFQVPEDIKVHRGDLLLVDTIRGEQLATATSDIFEGDGATEIAIRFGAYLPIRKVICAKNKRTIIRIARELLAEICEMEEEEKEEDLPF